jgi:mRNA interferase MazF
MGRVPLTRGEIRWYTFQLPDKRRPVLVLTRNEVIDRLHEIIVAPVTRTIRGLRTEVLLTEEDGLPTACAANFDHLALGQRNRFGSLLCTLPKQRWPEIRRALLTACGFDEE